MKIKLFVCLLAVSSMFCAQAVTFINDTSKTIGCKGFRNALEDDGGGWRTYISLEPNSSEIFNEDAKFMTYIIDCVARDIEGLAPELVITFHEDNIGVIMIHRSDESNLLQPDESNSLQSDEAKGRRRCNIF